jgi:hypothetical protein
VAVKNNCKCKTCAHINPNKVVKIKKERVPSANNYWFDSTETKIVEYVNSNDVVERELIYKDHLQEPLRRIVEAMFSSFLFDKILAITDKADAINECLSFVHINILPKINLDKGFAFGYINICVKRYFQQWNMRLTNYNIKHEALINLTSEGVEEDNDTRIELSTFDKLHDNIDFKEYLGYLTKYVEVNFNAIVRSDKQKRVLSALVKIMKQSDSFDFKKKTIYREMRTEAGVSTSNFTHVVLRVRDIHIKLFEEYKNTGKCEIPVLQTDKPKSRKHVFTLIHVSTKQVIEGKRTHIHKKLSNVNSKHVDNLLYGNSRECAGWKIVS